MSSGSGSTAAWRTPWASASLVLLIGAALSLLGDLIGAAIENPEATAPLMLLPQLILGFLSVGVQPVERFPSWIQPFVRNQPASQEVYALRALAGDSTPTAGSVSWPVIGPTLLWVAGVIVVLFPLHVLSCLSAAMMSVALEGKTTVAHGGFGDVRPAPRRGVSENSPMRLAPQTWVLTARLLRRWRRDPTTVLESLAMPVVLLVDTEHRSR